MTVLAACGCRMKIGFPSLGQMTAGTRYGCMRAIERIVRLVMRGQSIRGRAESFDHVACLASILIRRGGKLAAMRVAVAVLAGCEGPVVLRVFAFGYVALFALDCGMLTHQRIGGFVMIFHREARGLEAALVMAASAIAAIGSFGELTRVRVPVAVHAAREDYRRFEIVTLVAALAGHLHVLAQ